MTMAAGAQSNAKPAVSCHSSTTSLFVKVNVEGVPIGRKVDLSSFSSYESLKLALEDMFQPFMKENLSASNPEEKQHVRFLHSEDYILTHENHHGDWVSVGDVPWEMFVATVKRLRVMRNNASVDSPLLDADKKLPTATQP